MQKENLPVVKEWWCSTTRRQAEDLNEQGHLLLMNDQNIQTALNTVIEDSFDRPVQYYYYFIRLSVKL